MAKFQRTFGNIGFDTLVARVEKIVTEMKKEIGCPDTKVIATGGMAHIVKNNSSVIDVINPDLTLTGLRLIYEKNQI